MAHQHTGPEPGGGPVQRRDQGMRRVSTATRWAVAAAATVSAALGLAYTHLLPGAPAAPAAGTACAQPPAPAAPAPATGRETDDGGENTDDSGENAAVDGEQSADAVQPTAAVCPDGTTGTGLNPPAQPPAPAQQAPQTRTGAS